MDAQVLFRVLLLRARVAPDVAHRALGRRTVYLRRATPCFHGGGDPAVSLRGAGGDGLVHDGEVGRAVLHEDHLGRLRVFSGGREGRKVLRIELAVYLRPLYDARRGPVPDLLVHPTEVLPGVRVVVEADVALVLRSREGPVREVGRAGDDARAPLTFQQEQLLVGDYLLNDVELDVSRLDLLFDEVPASGRVDELLEQQLLKVEVGTHIPQYVGAPEDDLEPLELLCSLVDDRHAARVRQHLHRGIPCYEIFEGVPVEPFETCPHHAELRRLIQQSVLK